MRARELCRRCLAEAMALPDGLHRAFQQRDPPLRKFAFGLYARQRQKAPCSLREQIQALRVLVVTQQPRLELRHSAALLRFAAEFEYPAEAERGLQPAHAADITTACEILQLHTHRIGR